MNTIILSLTELEAKALHEFGPKTSLISIGDTDARMPVLVHHPHHILRLTFDDLTPEDAAERLELPRILSLPEEKMRAILLRYHTRLYDDRIAKRLSAFVYQHIDDTDTLICQCEYGQSRSPACAAAIMEHFFGDGNAIWTDPRYHPNRWVYLKTLTALYNDQEKQHGKSANGLLYESFLQTVFFNRNS